MEKFFSLYFRVVVFLFFFKQQSNSVSLGVYVASLLLKDSMS